MSCPHRELCEECKRLEAGQARTMAWICAIVSPILALIAFIFACKLDSRANALLGMAIGSVLVWFYNTAEAIRILRRE